MTRESTTKVCVRCRVSRETREYRPTKTGARKVCRLCENNRKKIKALSKPRLCVDCNVEKPGHEYRGGRKSCKECEAERRRAKRKTCIHCNVEKGISSFPRHGGNYRNVCKVCYSKQSLAAQKIRRNGKHAPGYMPAKQYYFEAVEPVMVLAANRPWK